jgi:hypothetical protein
MANASINKANLVQWANDIAAQHQQQANYVSPQDQEKIDLFNSIKTGNAQQDKVLWDRYVRANQEVQRGMNPLKPGVSIAESFGGKK